MDFYEYIISVLQNYADSILRDHSIEDDDLIRPGLWNAGDDAREYVESLKKEKEAPSIDAFLSYISKLASNEYVKKSVKKPVLDLIKQINSYLDYAPHHGKILVSDEDFRSHSIKDLTYMSAFKRWNDAARSINLEDPNADRWYSEGAKVAAINAAIQELDEQNKDVWNPSKEYKEFQRSLAAITKALDEEATKSHLDRLYNEAIKKGQAYLSFKAGDRKINDKGYRRYNAVNNIIQNLMTHKIQESGMESIGNALRIAQLIQIKRDAGSYNVKTEDLGYYEDTIEHPVDAAGNLLTEQQVKQGSPAVAATLTTQELAVWERLQKADELRKNDGLPTLREEVPQLKNYKNYLDQQYYMISNEVLTNYKICEGLLSKDKFALYLGITESQLDDIQKIGEQSRSAHECFEDCKFKEDLNENDVIMCLAHMYNAHLNPHVLNPDPKAGLELVDPGKLSEVYRDNPSIKNIVNEMIKPANRTKFKEFLNSPEQQKVILTKLQQEIVKSKAAKPEKNKENVHENKKEEHKLQANHR